MIEKGAQREFQWKNVGHQYFAALSVNLIMLGHGTIIGWISPALDRISSEDSPLKTGPLTNEQVSWIGSINCFGACAGTFSFGYLSSLIGCKRVMFFLAIPSIIFWIMVYFGDTYYYILIARVFSGWCSGGTQSTIVMYIAEIANNDIRGRLESFNNLLRNVGVLITFIVGAFVRYEYLPLIFVTIQIAYMAVFFFLPNTPQFHVKHGNFEKAEKSLKYYKGYKGDSKEEINAINQELGRLKSLEKEKKVDEKMHLKDFCEKSAVKGLAVGLMLAIIAQTPGTYTFISYAVLLFKKTGSKIDPNVSSVVMAVLQIFGNLCSAKFADSLGRKLLSVVSLLGSAIGNAIFALYMYLHLNGSNLSGFSWVPVSCVSFVMFVASAGIIPLTGVYTIESLPTKIRGTGLVICATAQALATFACVKSFPILVEIIELDGFFTILATCCFVGSLFVFVVMKETKGKPMDVLGK